MSQESRSQPEVFEEEGKVFTTLKNSLVAKGFQEIEERPSRQLITKDPIIAFEDTILAFDSTDSVVGEGVWIPLKIRIMKGGEVFKKKGVVYSRHYLLVIEPDPMLDPKFRLQKFYTLEQLEPAIADHLASIERRLGRMYKAEFKKVLEQLKALFKEHLEKLKL